MNNDLQTKLPLVHLKKWGELGVPLIPESITGVVETPLPSWLCDLCGFPPDTDIAELSIPIATELSERNWDRIVRYVLAWFAFHEDAIRQLKAVQLPAGLRIDFDAIPWSIRTSHCLRRKGFHSQPETLKELSFDKLLKIPGIGERSALDFAVMLVLWAKPLEEALQDLLKSFSWLAEDKYSQVIGYRFGLQGEEPETLAKVGNRFGITRERVRQIEGKMLRKLPKYSFFIPQLEKAARLLEDTGPLTTLGAMQLMIDKKITSINFHPKSIIEACKFFNIETGLKINKVRGQEIVAVNMDEKTANRLYSMARKKAGKSGAASIKEVVNSAQAEQLEYEGEQITRLLKIMNGIEYLDENYFWIPAIPVNRNRLINLSRRMLSVASPIHVKNLRAGARQAAHLRNISGGLDIHIPPTAILIKFYTANPEFEIDEGGFVRYIKTLDYKTELGERESILVDIIRSTPTSLLNRFSLRAKCKKRGMNLSSFELALTYSPIIEHVDTDIWTLRGLSINPAQVEALRVENSLQSRQRRVVSFSWKESGEVVINVRVSSITPSTFVFGVPSDIKRYFAGKKFSAIEPASIVGRTLKVLDTGGVLGSAAILNRLKASEGDVADFIFNLVDKTVAVEINNDESSEL